MHVCSGVYCDGLSACIHDREVNSLIRENSVSVCLVINSTSQRNVFPLTS